MDTNALVSGLLQFVAFVMFVVLHEFAHAWMANRLGDDTPRSQGRLTLDPMAHIDWLGTIILPLVLVLMGVAAGRTLLMGWGRPVEVNMSNFRNPAKDDILVSGAGPAMNFIIAVVIVVIVTCLDRAGWGSSTVVNGCFDLARLSLFLCLFNLLPIPPLDGGHIMRRFVGLTDESYHALSQYSFLFFLIIMRVPAITEFVSAYTQLVLNFIAWPFGWTSGQV